MNDDRRPVLANYNGEEMPLKSVLVPALDRAYLFGDAVYEVVRVYGGHLWKGDEHLRRLASSLVALKIAGVNLDEVRARAEGLLARSELKEALVYIQVTRGIAPRTHHYPDNARANVLVYAEPFDDPSYAQIRQLGARAITFPDIRWARNDIKCTSLAANCLAAQAARDEQALEAILIDPAGLVTEGSHSSIFAVAGGKLLVSPSSQSILPGITKQQIIDLSKRSGIGSEERRLRKDELWDLDEIIMTSTPEEIIGIVKVDDRLIGDGKPGPVTEALQAAFRQSVAAWLAGAD